MDVKNAHLILNKFKLNLFFLKLSLLLILTVYSSLALCNFVGNDTNNFNPTPDGLDFLTVHSSEVLAPGILSSSLFLTYATNTLPDAYDSIGQKFTSNDKIFFSDLGFAYSLTDRFELGLTISTLVDQKTNRAIDDGAQFGSTGLNEIRLNSKYNLIKRNPFGAAAIVSVNINESKNNPFAGTGPGPTLNIEGVADYRFDQILVSTNFGYRFRQNGKKILGAYFKPLPNQYIASIAASYYLTGLDVKLISEIFAAKAVQSTQDVASNQISSEALGGLKYDSSNHISLQAGLGSRIGKGLFTPDWRFYAGANFNFDIFHKPSAVNVDIKPIKLTEVKKMKPSDVELLMKQSFDTIARQHEFYLRTAVAQADFSGAKNPFEIIRLENFDFEFGSYKINPDYYLLLDRLVSYLVSAPEVIKIRVEGHTDSLGSPDRNRIVSQERANSVTDYLKNNGLISSIKMESIGFGADRPIADNGNFQGRRQNRRVEIRLVRNLAEPTDQ